METNDLDPRASDLLDFWFGDDPDDAAVADAKQNLWWKHDPAADDEVRERFGELARLAAAGDLDRWARTPRGLLALILLLDQVPRMVARGTPGAFATDRSARAFTRAGLARGFDRPLRPIERVFLLMPLEHSETLADQEESVRRFRDLAAEVPTEWRPAFDSFLDFAERHREVVARFHRFPHRNEILGRESTPAEKEYLAEPGAGF